MPDTVLDAITADATPGAAQLLAGLAADFLEESAEGDSPVTSAASADELYAIVDEPLPQDGHPLTDVVARLRRDILPHAIRLSHPMYLGHQVSAPLPAAVWTDALISALNNSLAVREMSPIGTAVETRVVRWMAELVGYGPSAGGTLTSGGTEATFTALLSARAATLPEAWEHGVGANPPVVLCGEHAHYAVTRAVAELGLGLRGALAVPSAGYRMDPEALKEMLDRLAAEGRTVMAVVATAGSTATGSFDDLERIGRICERRGLWLHVDGAHGAAAVLSSSRQARVAGLRYARSIAWDPHKMLLLPLSAGMLIVRDERDLARAFSQRAPYLFHDDGERSWDLGPRSFACSRRFDALKLWVALQRYGARGLGQLYDHLAELATYLHERIQGNAEFDALHAPECNILCFRWLPPGVTEAASVDALNRQLRQRYNQSGAGWITLTVLDSRPVLRVTVMNPRTTRDDLDQLLAGLAAEGRALLAGTAG